MLRSMMQAYVRESGKAVELYKRAFDARLVSEYPLGDGNFYHSELDVYGQILSVAEAIPMQENSGGISDEAAGFLRDTNRTTGNTMQFCLHFGKGNADKVHKSYEVLKEGGLILSPLGPVDFSPCMADVIDRFGVRWCLFE